MLLPVPVQLVATESLLERVRGAEESRGDSRVLRAAPASRFAFCPLRLAATK